MPLRDVVGHRRLLSLLARAVARDTLPPALLLAGPAGVGKKRVAAALATAINCTAPRSEDPLERDACGACPPCRRIARGIHPDVVVVAPGDSGSIKIEAVRPIIDQANDRPFEARRRVVIIDEADALTVDAQDALLKTLEEPPAASIFLLVSSLPDALLPTVRSRCPRLRFAPLTPGEVATVLVRDHDYSEVEARAAAVDAEGSVGRALSSASTDLVDARATATRVLHHVARAADPSTRLGSVQDLSPKKPTPMDERNHVAACLRIMASMLRDLGIIASQADAGLIANADLRADLEVLSRAYDAKRSMRAYTAIDEALAALERNANAKVVANWLVLQL